MRERERVCVCVSVSVRERVYVYTPVRLTNATNQLELDKLKQCSKLEFPLRRPKSHPSPSLEIDARNSFL